MPKYRYKAFDVSGDLVTSTIVAPNHQEARVELERLELMVSSLRASLTLGKSGKKIGTKVFFQFNKELAVLVKSGVPLAEAVDYYQLKMLSKGCCRLYLLVFISILLRVNLIPQPVHATRMFLILFI